MSTQEGTIDQEDLKVFTNYFSILLQVFKRIKDESKRDPTIVDYLEPEFRLFLLQN